MKNILIKEMTPAKVILLILIFSFILIIIVNYYGGYFKDTITKNTCPLFGEEYERGDKRGYGKCITPAGRFD